jgi:hypothetical protein
MNLRAAVVCVVALVGWSALALADEKPADEFARVQVRGKLTEWKFQYLERDQYAVQVSKQGGGTFLLVLPDEAAKKAAKELVGQVVVVDGTLEITQVGDGKRNESKAVVGKVTVKSLKKADAPKD